MPVLALADIGRLPAAPGVYLFRDAAGGALYVGKSINLRRRVAQYFGKSVLRNELRIRRMAAAAASVDCVETATELEALVLEDELIKQHRPEHNRALSKYRDQCYVRLTRHPPERLVVVSDRSAAGGEDCFGPFPNEYFATDLVALVNGTFLLRTCADDQPTEPCIEAELGHCSAPCRDAASRRTHEAGVAAARRFLTGDTEPAISQLLDAMRKAERSLQFEQATRYRDDAEFCRSFATHQQFLSWFGAAPVAIRDRDVQHPWSYLFDGGHLGRSVAGTLLARELVDAAASAVAATAAPAARQPEGDAPPAPQAPLEAWAMADRAGVVRRWLAGTETAEYLCLGLSDDHRHAHDVPGAIAPAESRSAAPDAWLPGQGLAIAARRAQQSRRRGHPQPR